MTGMDVIHPDRPRQDPARAVELLDFTVRIVRDEAALRKAVQVRHAAFARHAPAFSEKLRQPEPDDTADDCALLLAESKRDGEPLGSMRSQVNSVRPLPITQHVQLPAWLSGKRLADARRLSVAQGAGATQVRHALFKAYFLWIQNALVDWSLVGARPPLNRMYERLLFSEILDGATFIPDAALPAPHQVLAFEVDTAQRRWTQAKHPLLNFVFCTNHPDIDVADGRVHTSTDRPSGVLPSRCAG